MTVRLLAPSPLREIGEIDGVGPVWLKDESVHPSGTFKDRLAQQAVRTSISPRPCTFAAISYGNTALSFGLFTRETPHRFVWFYPHRLPRWKLGPSTCGTWLSGKAVLGLARRLGVETIPLNLQTQYWGSEELWRLAQKSTGDLPGDFVDVTNGLSLPSYQEILLESVLQMPVAPAICIVQYGAGVLADEFNLAARQRSLDIVIFPVSTARPNSAARMLYGPYWLDVQELRQAGVTKSRRPRSWSSAPAYDVFGLREREIRRGLSIAAEFDVDAEPSGAAGLGFLHRIPSLVNGYQRGRDPVLVINTGNALDRMKKLIAESEEK